jgi:heme exporter protein CcmD
MNAYVGAGYGITFATLALYAWWVVRRQRVLRRGLTPPEETPR